MVKERDPLTGQSITYQRGRLDDAYLMWNGHFDVAEYNRVNREKIDIGNIQSMSAIYKYSTNYFQNRILSMLDFVRCEKGLYFSCVSSLAAHAHTHVTAARTAQSRAGLTVGIKNLL